MSRTTRVEVEALFRDLMNRLEAPYDENNPYQFKVVDGENTGYCLDCYRGGGGWTLMLAIPAGRSGSKEWMLTQVGLDSGRLGIKAFAGALRLVRLIVDAEIARKAAQAAREEKVGA